MAAILARRNVMIDCLDQMMSSEVTWTIPKGGVAIQRHNLIAQLNKSQPARTNLLCLALGNLLIYIGQCLKTWRTKPISDPTIPNFIPKKRSFFNSLKFFLLFIFNLNDQSFC